MSLFFFLLQSTENAPQHVNKMKWSLKKYSNLYIVVSNLYSNLYTTHTSVKVTDYQKIEMYAFHTFVCFVTLATASVAYEDPFQLLFHIPGHNCFTNQ